MSDLKLNFTQIYHDRCSTPGLSLGDITSEEICSFWWLLCHCFDALIWYPMDLEAKVLILVALPVYTRIFFWFISLLLWVWFERLFPDREGEEEAMVDIESQRNSYISEPKSDSADGKTQTPTSDIILI
jgi:hypothetical protein